MGDTDKAFWKGVLYGASCIAIGVIIGRFV